MDKLESLLFTLNNTALSDDDRIHAVEQLDELDNPEAADPLLIQLANSQNSLWLRRSIAICLGRHQIDEAVPIIIDILKDPASANYRGSFLYAMWDLDSMPYLPFIAETLATDTYESSNHCCFIIRNQAHKIEPQLKEQMLDILNNYRIVYETGNIPSHSLTTDAKSTLDFIEWGIELIEYGEEYLKE